MFECIVVVEGSSDVEIATRLAERVIVENSPWLEAETLAYVFKWSGLVENTEHSYWKNTGDIIKHFASEFRFPKIRSNGKLKTDGKAARKIMTLISFLQHKQKRNIKAVILIRDLDNQPERREHIEQARSEYTNQQPTLEIVIGTADRMREAWVLNGFIPSSQEEEEILENIKRRLNFDPCEDSHKLRSNSFSEPERGRNPKVVLEELTGNERFREQKCWEETSLEVLQQRGQNTGLKAYLQEIQQRMIPIIVK
jgi:hypothetical protein